MKAEELLFSQGFGTRRECRNLIFSGRFSLEGNTVGNPALEVGAVHGHTSFSVDGVEWIFFEKVIVALNKPAGYECSAKPSGHPGVLSLLPVQLVRRRIQPVGRLDVDTTGLLLLTDDGILLHRLTHPKRHVSKTYEVGCRYPVDAELCAKLLHGVELKGDGIVRAGRVESAGGRSLVMEIFSGRYHQVKRMVVAAGNRVEELRRVSFGAMRLPADLPAGGWMYLDSAADVLGRESGSAW